MKQYVDPIPDGGAPLTNNRINNELQKDLRESITAILAPFNGDTEGVILSGCEITANGGNFDMTAGVVYLSGIIARVGAVVNQSYPKYIQLNPVSETQKVFADLVSRTLLLEYTATVGASMPGGFQYIEITGLDSANARKRRLSTYTRGACVAQARVEGFGGTGIVYQSGIPLVSSSDTLAEITITHNLGTTNYTVAMTQIKAGGVTDNMGIDSIGSNSFKICNLSGAGRGECYIQIFIQ